ncbi:hypothetical protein [Arenibaculum sp.]|jgi:hypothetical protein|nr:hypothetical protein [Arenibaculum sp.]
MRNRTAIDRRGRAVAAARDREDHLRAMALVAGAALMAGCFYGLAVLS